MADEWINGKLGDDELRSGMTGKIQVVGTDGVMLWW